MKIFVRAAQGQSRSWSEEDNIQSGCWSRDGLESWSNYNNSWIGWMFEFRRYYGWARACWSSRISWSELRLPKNQ